MIYRTHQIISMVKSAIGRNHLPQPLIGALDPDAVDLDSRIACLIQQTARDVYAETPLALLVSEAKTFHSGGVYWHEPIGGIYSGHVLLPEDFMRLVAFEMSDWERPVFEALNGESAQYATTRSRFPGICGSIHRPVAAIINLPEGRALEFHSCKSEDAYISQASYIATPTIDSHHGIDIAGNCIASVIAALSSKIINHTP